MKLGSFLKTQINKQVKNNIPNIHKSVGNSIGNLRLLQSDKLNKKLNDRLNKEYNKRVVQVVDIEINTNINKLETRINKHLADKGINLSTDGTITGTNIKYKGFNFNLTEASVKEALLNYGHGVLNQEIDKVRNKLLSNKHMSRLLDAFNKIREVTEIPMVRYAYGLVDKRNILANYLLDNPIYSGLNTISRISSENEGYYRGESDPVYIPSLPPPPPFPPEGNNNVELIDVVKRVVSIDGSSSVMGSGKNACYITFYELDNPFAMEMQAFPSKRSIEYIEHRSRQENTTSGNNSKTHAYKTKSTIVMPMPSSLSQGFSSDWEEYSNIWDKLIKNGFGGIDSVEGAVQAFNKYTGGAMNLAEVMALPTAVTTAVEGSVTAGVTAGIDEALQYMRAVGGMVINPMTTLSYASHSTRSHTFTWNLTPKSKDDWEVIKKAYYTLLSGSYANNAEELASVRNGHRPINSASAIHGNYGLIYKKTLICNIDFKDRTTGRPVFGVMNIPDCHVADVNIEYSPNTRVFTVTNDDYPISIKITVTFREKYNLTRSDYKYLKNGYANLNKGTTFDKWGEFNQYNSRSRTTMEQAINTGAITKTQIEEVQKESVPEFPNIPNSNNNTPTTPSVPPTNIPSSTIHPTVAQRLQTRPANYGIGSTGKCGVGVRTILGLNTSIWEHSASQAKGAYYDINNRPVGISKPLLKLGYRKIAEGTGWISGIKFQAGDIVVMTARKGLNPTHAGHIQIYNNNGKWVSDHVQRRDYSGNYLSWVLLRSFK